MELGLGVFCVDRPTHLGVRPLSLDAIDVFVRYVCSTT